MAGEIDMLFYVTMNMVAVAVKAVGITMKQKQLRHGIGGMTVTSYACWLAVIAGDAPENWEDKDEK